MVDGDHFPPGCCLHKTNWVGAGWSLQSGSGSGHRWSRSGGVCQCNGGMTPGNILYNILDILSLGWLLQPAHFEPQTVHADDFNMRTAWDFNPRVNRLCGPALSADLDQPDGV